MEDQTQLEINEFCYWAHYRVRLDIDVAHEIEIDGKKWYKIMSYMDLRKAPYKLPKSCCYLEMEFPCGFVWQITENAFKRIESITPGYIRVGEPFV